VIFLLLLARGQRCGVERAIRYSLLRISSFKYIFSGATSYQELLDGSSPTFMGLVGLINFAFIWQSLKGRCQGNQRKSENRRFSQKKISLSHCQSETDRNVVVH